MNARSSDLRATRSAAAPTASAAGAPARKSATANSPPSLESLATASNPNSSAAALMLGESKFWSLLMSAVHAISSQKAELLRRAMCRNRRRTEGRQQ
eukprot:256245-Prymnesium_polylepis.3